MRHVGLNFCKVDTHSKKPLTYLDAAYGLSSRAAEDDVACKFRYRPYAFSMTGKYDAFIFRVGKTEVDDTGS